MKTTDALLDIINHLKAVDVLMDENTTLGALRDMKKSIPYMIELVKIELATTSIKKEGRKNPPPLFPPLEGGKLVPAI